MTGLCCRLAGHSDLRIAWDDALQPAMAGLQALIGGSMHPEDGAADFVLRATAGGAHRAGLEFDEARQRICCRISPSAHLSRQTVLWRTAVICAAGSRLLRGEPLCLMHGCLLELPKGGGVFLCGQSGMGKSTTAERWRAAGGVSPADDMVLMERKDDGFCAHPLPTWSRCRESLEGERVSFEKPLEVRSVLALSRDETAEAIRAVEPFKYISALYSSCCLFNRELAKLLPLEVQKEFIRALQEYAKQLCDIFPPRTLFANLRGDLKQSLSILE